MAVKKAEPKGETQGFRQAYKRTGKEPSGSVAGESGKKTTPKPY